MNTIVMASAVVSSYFSTLPSPSNYFATLEKSAESPSPVEEAKVQLQKKEDSQNESEEKLVDDNMLELAIEFLMEFMN